jgi:hypothetical protein
VVGVALLSVSDSSRWKHEGIIMRPLIGGEVEEGNLNHSIGSVDIMFDHLEVLQMY